MYGGRPPAGKGVAGAAGVAGRRQARGGAVFFGMSRSIKAHIHQGKSRYVAERIDVPVVTQGRTLHEAFDNLREAVGLFFEGEGLAGHGLAPDPPLPVTVEIELPAHAG